MRRPTLGGGPVICGDAALGRGVGLVRRGDRCMSALCGPRLSPFGGSERESVMLCIARAHAGA